MNAFAATFATVSVPIALACAGGIALAWKGALEVRTLTSVSLYVLAPCLVVVVLAGSTQPAQVFRDIAVFSLLHAAATTALGWGAGRLLRLPSGTRSALTLATVFSNCNNYGLPVLLLAYGESGLSLGAAYVIGQVVLVNTLGMFLAARSSFSAKDALRRIASVPLVYACLAGLALYAFSVPLPDALASGFRLLGNAYPALVLVILGIQIRQLTWRGLGRKGVWIAIALRMVVAPLISILLIHLLRIEGLLARVLLVETAMPAAVNAVVLGERYGSDVEMLTATVSISTVLSFIAIPIWIHLA